MRTSVLSRVNMKSGQGQKGPWTMYQAEFANGDKASTFDASLGKFMQENTGSLIDYDFAEDGKYKNLTQAVKHEGAAPVGSDAMRPRHPNDSRQIVRQTALKCAVELVAAGKIEMTNLRQYADKFVDWVYEGEGELHIKGDWTPQEVQGFRAEAQKPSAFPQGFDPDKIPV